MTRMIPLAMVLLASVTTFAAEIDPEPNDVDSFVDFCDDGGALGTQGLPADTLRLNWHAARGPERYRGICLFVQTATAVGTTAEVVVTALQGQDLHSTQIFTGTIPTDVAGIQCVEFSAGTQVNASFFDNDVLVLSSASKIGKGVLVHVNTNFRVLDTSTSPCSFGARFDNNLANPTSVPVRASSRELTGVTGSAPADLSPSVSPNVFTSDNKMPWLALWRD